MSRRGSSAVRPSGAEEEREGGGKGICDAAALVGDEKEESQKGHLLEGIPPEALEVPGSGEGSGSAAELIKEALKALSDLFDSIFGKDPRVLLRIINVAAATLFLVMSLFIYYIQPLKLRLMSGGFLLLLVCFTATVNWVVFESLKFKAS